MVNCDVILVALVYSAVGSNCYVPTQAPTPHHPPPPPLQTGYDPKDAISICQLMVNVLQQNN